MAVTEEMARFAIHTKEEDVPEEVMARSCGALLDTFGVALAGTREPVSGIALDWVDELGARPQSTLWGRKVATSPAEAAFANGIAAHALDFDDSLPTLRGHPSATIIAAAMAVGEAKGSSGAQMLASYAIGVEIAGKLGRAFGDGHYLRGWHTTSTVGVFSAAVAAGRLWGLDVHGMQMAWGLAASQMGGLVRNFGTMSKSFHVGQAARAGVLAAWMAKRGFTADSAIFDGANSVLETYGGNDGIDLAASVVKLGRPWELLVPGLGVKRWPCCYGTHRPLAGLIALTKQHGLDVNEIQRIDIGFIAGNDAALISSNPQTGLEGKFSIEYAAAAMLVDGKIGLESFSDAMLRRPEIRALMAKVRRYHVDPAEVVAGAPVFVKVSVTTARGCFEARVDRAPGSSEAPMDDADRLEKFMDCAQRVLSPERARTLHTLIMQCGQLTNVGDLVRAAAA